jgi:hypothetical protein
MSNVKSYFLSLVVILFALFTKHYSSDKIKGITLAGHVAHMEKIRTAHTHTHTHLLENLEHIGLYRGES